MAKIKWKELDGELKFVVQAIDVNGNFRIFHFNVYVDRSLAENVKKDYIQRIAMLMIELRNCHMGKFLAVEQVKGDAQ